MKKNLAAASSSHCDRQRSNTSNLRVDSDLLNLGGRGEKGTKPGSEDGTVFLTFALTRPSLASVWPWSEHWSTQRWVRCSGSINHVFYESAQLYRRSHHLPVVQGHWTAWEQRRRGCTLLIQRDRYFNRDVLVCHSQWCYHRVCCSTLFWKNLFWTRSSWYDSENIHLNFVFEKTLRYHH